jgi:hypothetical protein
MTDTDREARAVIVLVVGDRDTPSRALPRAGVHPRGSTAVAVASTTTRGMTDNRQRR